MARRSASPAESRASARRPASQGRKPAPAGRATPRVAVSLVPYPDYQIGVLQGVRSYLAAHPGAFEIAVRGGSPYLRPDDLAGVKFEGVIANIPAGHRETFARLRTPLVRVGSRGPDPGRPAPLVEMDNEQAGRVAASHLAGLGVAAVGAVGLAGVHWSRARLKGFTASAAALGLQVSTLELTGGEEVEPPDRAVLGDWLRGRPRPGAIFAATDLLARGVTDAARAAGLAVPRDLAVLGFNNGLYECLFAEPHLSSVPQDRLRLGYESARLMHELLTGRVKPENAAGVQVRAGPAVRRRSTALLAWTDPVLKDCLEFFHRQLSDVAGLTEVFEAYPEQRLRLVRRLDPALGGAPDPAEAARLRLTLAEQLVRESRLPLARVAEFCGYWEEPRLALAFRDAFKCDPAPYRARHGRLAQP